MQCPGRAVADAELAFERQRRKLSLGLAEQMDGQKPGGQGQLRSLHHTPADQRGLMSKGIALKHLGSAPVQDSAGVARAARVAKAFRPACPFQRRFALGLGAVLDDEYR